jgi:hypothetical protein
MMQLGRLVIGVVLAVVIIVKAGNILERIPAAVKSQVGVLHKARVCVLHLGTFALIVFAYFVGGVAAYQLSTKLGASTDSAWINGFYSWLYVGDKFCMWMVAHRNEPIGQAVSDFGMMMRK